jgi:hypothetical protein
MIDYWCNARQRTILEACDFIEYWVLIQCETPNDIWGVWLYRWSSIDIMWDNELYWRFVILSNIEFWYNATYWMIRKVCSYINDKVSMKLLVKWYWWPVIVFIAWCRWNTNRCEVLVSASVKFSIPNDFEFLCSYRLSGIDDMRDNQMTSNICDCIGYLSFPASLEV